MKKLKKFLAAVIAATMAATGLVMPANAEADYVWLEAEDGDITGYKTLVMNTTSGGKGVLLENTTGDAGQVEWEFEIAETGMYDIKILTSSGIVSHLSRYKWSLDGSAPAYNNNAAIGSLAYTAGMLMTSQPVSWFPITSVSLTAGTHTMVVSCDEKRTLANDWISHFFDCVAIVPSEWSWSPDGLTKPSKPVADDEEASDGYFWMEAEDFTIPSGSTFAKYTHDSASEGAYLGANGNGIEPVVTQTFYVEEAGDYDLKVLCINNSDWLSKTQWSLDASAFAPCAEKESDTIYSVKTVFTSWTDQSLSWYAMGTVELTEGQHTLTIKALPRSADNAVIHAFDVVAIAPASWNWTPDGMNKPSEPTKVDVTGVSLEKSTLSLEVGQNHTLAYTVSPVDATDKGVSWSSTDASVAYVSDTGVVTALSAGQTTVTITTDDGSFTDTCEVTVTAPEGVETIDGLVWLEAEGAIINGTGYTVVNDTNASGGKVFQTQKSDNNPITLTMPFEIEKAGKYNIRILGSQSWPMHLTNYKVKIDGEEAKNVPSTTNPSVYHHYLVVELPAHWHDIATMELAEGTHMISVILDSRRSLADDMMLAFIDAIGIAPVEWDWDITKITKPQAPVAVEEVDIAEESIELIGGESYELSYDFLPENAAASDLVWISSNSTVASVSDGVVTAISGGKATITLKSATNDEIYDTCEVTVLAAKANAAFVKIVNVTNTNQPGVGKNNGIVQVRTAQEEGTVYTFDVPFAVPEEGTYDVYYTGSPNGVQHASYAQYKVDGGEAKKVTESKFYASKGYANKADSTLEVKWQKFEKLTLDTEEHTITFIYDNYRGMDDMAYMFGIEYLVLVPTGTELELDATGDTSAAENLAEVLATGIFLENDVATDDLLLHKNALDGTPITWTSSDPSIINENGKVTRPGYYEEDATVTMTASFSVTKVGFTYNATKDFVIKVPKLDAYTVKNFGVEYDSGEAFGEGGSGTLTASVYVSDNTGDTSKTAALVLVRYDALGAMADVSYKSINLTSTPEKITTSIEISEETAGETVEAFIWTDMGTKKLIDGNILTFKK